MVMMTLGFSRSFSCSFRFSFILFCRPPPSYASLALRFLSRFHTLFAHASLPAPFCVGSLSGIFAEVSSFVLSLGPLRFSPLVSL